MLENKGAGERADPLATGFDRVQRGSRGKEGVGLGFAGSVRLSTAAEVCAAMSAGWRTHWRTSGRIPANKLFCNGLESR